MRRYSQAWNRRNIPRWRVELAEFTGTVFHYLEVGCHECRTLGWVVRRMMTAPGCTATGIDTWESFNRRDGRTSERRAKLNTTRHGSMVRLIKGDGAAVMASMWDETRRPLFDVIFVDARHGVENILVDAALAWRLLKPAGVLILDDRKESRHVARCLVRLLRNARIMWQSRRQVAVRKWK